MKADVRTRHPHTLWRALRRGVDALRLRLGMLLFALVCMDWTVLALPLYWLLPRKLGTWVGRWGITLVFREYVRGLQWMGICQFDLSALDALRDDPGLVIAPNHPSLLDAVLVISRLPHVSCVMKAELMDNLLLGSGARLARYIRNDSLRSMVQLAVADVRKGNHLLLFPEGTRTTRTPVNRLQGTVGLIAKQAQVPVQTVFIETNSPFLGKDWPLLRCPAMPVVYRVRLGKRFDPPDNVEAFARTLEQYFQTELAHALLPDLPVTEYSR
ncbi:lysophospholipid acyltransferase family protein [Rhodoferax sp.]|uniref:lysophospholipid acyltransferase family protein n=1 Tax=Rhodoferax sp. TaxID=50421 RepID=UPI0025D1B92E|nr:lysophospholipid acyltransferase family protein [Rhodoferax sp.]